MSAHKQLLFDMYMDAFERMRAIAHSNNLSYESIVFHEAHAEMLAASNAWEIAEFGKLLTPKHAVTDWEVQPEQVESVTANVCKHCGRGFYNCNCDYCELEGHDWIGLSGSRACRSCGIEEDVTPLSWMEEAAEETLEQVDWKVHSPKSNIVRVKDAFENAKMFCSALPNNGFIEYVRGQGYFIRYLDDYDRKQTYCWLGWSERALKWLADVQATRIPNFAALRVGVK